MRPVTRKCIAYARAAEAVAIAAAASSSSRLPRVVMTMSGTGATLISSGRDFTIGGAGKRRTLIVEAEPQCGYHATGRSAAFYLESYGGPAVTPMTEAPSALKSPAASISSRVASGLA